MLLYLATEDAARDTLNVLSIEDMQAPGGLARIWSLLDDAYGQTAPDRFDRARLQYENCRRKPGQTMEAYISELKRAKLEWLAEDPQSAISDKAFAHKMLTGAGLRPKEQKELHYVS
eukprot:2424278-Amphidinium_carterae.1